MPATSRTLRTAGVFATLLVLCGVSRALVPPQTNYRVATHAPVLDSASTRSRPQPALLISAAPRVSTTRIPAVQRPAGQSAEPVVYLPNHTGRLRGWIVFVGRGDSLRFFENSRLRELADTLGLALLHFHPLSQVDGSGAAGEELCRILTEQAQQHARPELEYAPLVLFGHSTAFNYAVSFATEQPERVLGLIGFRTSDIRMTAVSPVVHRRIPWLVLAGELDTPGRVGAALNLLPVAQLERLPMTVVHQRKGHHHGVRAVQEGLPLMLAWVRWQVEQRLPAEPPPLGYPEIKRPDYQSGIAADMQTLGMKPVAADGLDVRMATWIPDAALARIWKRASAAVSPSQAPPALREHYSARRELTSGDASFPASVPGSDWNCWRGPAGTNHATGVPDVWEWSESSHVVWKTPIAGRGHSSPIVVSNHIYLTTVDEQQQLLLQSYNAQSGALEWERVLAKGKFPHINLKNSHASATVACDGDRLFVNWVSGGRLWLANCDLAGKVGWKRNVGEFSTEHGYGSSPLVFETLVIVSADISGEGYLAAFDRESGVPVWKTPRPGGASYGTPLVAHVAGRDQLILSGSHQTVSYNPRTGNRLWFCEGPSKTTGNTSACDALHVYTSGGNPEKRLLCIRADGSGDVTATHVVWEEKKATCYVPSPLVVGDRLFVLNDKGIANWVNAATGEVLWQERIGGNFTSSPLLVGDRLLMTSESGITSVVRAADTYELLAENRLDAEVLATPCVVDGRIYLRSTTHLYCLGETLDAGARIAESPASEEAASSRQ